MPAIELKSSAFRWGLLPGPVEPKLSLPGLALVWAMNSCTVFAGTLGCKNIPDGCEITKVIGAKSLIGS